MPSCLHHTLADAVFAFPGFALAAWIGFCAAITGTAFAFSRLVKTHTRPPPS